MPKKVVFFVPSFASSDATAPLGLLTVATPLLWARYSVRLIESTITPNYKKRALAEVKDALLLGISMVAGPIFAETGEIARAVRARGPFRARRRLDHDVYALQAELWLNEKLKRRTADAKSAVDATRLEPATSGATC